VYPGPYTYVNPCTPRIAWAISALICWNVAWSGGRALVYPHGSSSNCEKLWKSIVAFRRGLAIT
jgi:hypothetical protein